MHTKFPLLVFISVLLAGCAGLVGSVSTENYSNDTGNRTFEIIGPNTLSLRDKKIRGLISNKLIQYGYKPTSKDEKPNTAILYKLSIGQGATYVSSSPDYVMGGQKVESSTSYPRYMQIMIIDLQKSQLPDNVVMIWQGEVTSSGSSTNVTKLTKHFLDILFENYGKTVSDESFHRVVSW